MIRKAGFDQSINFNSTDFEAPMDKQAPNAFQSGISSYADTFEAANSNMFDFSAFANPATDRGIIVVGGKTDPGADRGIIVVGGKTNQSPEISLGSGDAVQLQDANFEGAHSSLAGETQPESLSLESLPGDTLDWSENAISNVGDAVTHPADTVGNAWYLADKALWDTGDAIDKGASAVGDFFSDTVVSDTTSWIGDRFEDAGDLLVSASNDFYYGVDKAGSAIADVYNDTPVLPDAVDTIGGAMGDILNWFGNLILYPGYTISNAVNTAEDFFGGVIDATGDAAKDVGGFVGGIVATTGNAAEDAGDVIKDVGNTIVEGASNVGDAISNAWDDLF